LRRQIATLALLGTALSGLWTYSRRAVQRFEAEDWSEAKKPGDILYVNGIGLHYVTAGQGPALLLIHGLGSHTFSFRHVMPELARHFRVVALDLKGFGFSERPSAGDYTLSGQAELVRGFMERLGIDRAAVLGHSMGGAVAMRLALAHPDRVERLILLASASDLELGRHVWGAALLRPLLPLVAPFTYYNYRFREKTLKSGYFNPDLCTEEIVEGYLRPAHIRGYLRALGNTMADWRKDPPLEPSAITRPTLILWGEADRWLPPSRGERLHSLIPDSRLVVLDRAGHMLIEERPEAVLEAILGFLLEKQAAASSAAGGTEQE
jgi:pimeloyl-ACP methyl ester carboxylesterase